jgi:hypothetical protein
MQMFISKKELTRMQNQIQQLRDEVRRLRYRTGVYVGDKGLLVGWDGDCVSVIDALNAMAKHTGFQWQQVPAQRATVEGIDGKPKSK